MEYFGFLSLGVAIAGIGMRFYFSVKAKAALQAENEQHLSPRARRVKEAAIVRRLLRYHRGLSHA